MTATPDCASSEAFDVLESSSLEDSGDKNAKPCVDHQEGTEETEESGTEANSDSNEQVPPRRTRFGSVRVAWHRMTLGNNRK